MKKNQIVTRILSLISLMALSIPAFAASEVQDRDHGRPRWEHDRCYNQREIERHSRRLTEQAERFDHTVDRTPGLGEVRRSAGRFVEVSREFSFRVDRARECRETRYEFRRVEEAYYSVEREYNETIRRGQIIDRFAEEEFRRLTSTFQELRFEIERR